MDLVLYLTRTRGTMVFIFNLGAGSRCNWIRVVTVEDLP